MVTITRIPSLAAFVAFVAFTVLGLAAPVLGQAPPRALVPTDIRLNEAASNYLQADWLTPAEARTGRVFHGVWDDRDLVDVNDRALAALIDWRLDDPSLTNPETDPVLRAEAAREAGYFDAALNALVGAQTPVASRIRAQALESLARYDAALDAAEEPIAGMLRETIDDPADLVNGVEALLVRARIEGQPARDYQAMMRLLGRAHQEIDRLHWPAKLAEARLLFEKSKKSEAVTALHETLALNPRCSEAWYLLGRIAVDSFDFDSAEVAANRLNRISSAHPLAALLQAEAALVQDDPDLALDTLEPLTERWPRLPKLYALIAAGHALRYDDDARDAALARFDEILPGSPLAYFTVGRHLSFNRQYEAAADMLGEAIRRQPAWPPPLIELGLMELQSGRDSRALDALERAVELDRFNVRAGNSLYLLEELANYEVIETEHFRIRHKPGEDEALIALMPAELEAMYEIVTSRFDFEPPIKTTIEVLPDHQRFGVRITGMPFIHTIAACTGPVIAMEVPREGSRRKHLGAFDWPRVIRHEFTHTVTLAQTRNRIPHWLTEAAAVSMELAPRSYDRCVMLARAYHEDRLFDLDEINWAFVRPQRPGDRGQAYAQGHWMVEFMDERFGESALVRLLDQYAQGIRDPHAFRNALGVEREAFYQAFLEWAGAQVDSWGLSDEPPLEELVDELRWANPDLAVVMAASQQARLDAITKRMAERIGQPVSDRKRDFRGGDWPELVRPPVDIDDATLAEWRETYPDHADLLRLELERMIVRAAPDDAIIAGLNEYAALRPVDPFPHRWFARYYLDRDDPSQAIEHLEALDAVEEKTPVYAVELAKLYRAAGDLDRAYMKALRAVNINPYHAANREVAAAIALERRDFSKARTHVRALTLIEPDRPIHQKRLEAIDRLEGAG